MSPIEIHLWVKSMSLDISIEVDENNKKVWVLKKMRRTIAFMRGSRMEISFSTSCE
jgi:hypothetical protein